MHSYSDRNASNICPLVRLFPYILQGTLRDYLLPRFSLPLHEPASKLLSFCGEECLIFVVALRRAVWTRLCLLLVGVTPMFQRGCLTGVAPHF